MPRVLTATAVANARPDTSRRLEITDGATPGLRLLIYPSGEKAFAFWYEMSGRRGKLTIGKAAGSGAISLAEARDRAGAARKQIAAGIDPAHSHREALAAETARVQAARDADARRKTDRLDIALDLFLDRYVSRLKSAHEVTRLLKKEVRGPWGDKVLSEIVRKDVVRLIDGIAARGAGTSANRTLANLKSFFAWCVDKHLIEISPCAGMRPTKREEARTRVLTDEELRLLILGIAALQWPWKQFFEVTLRTGQRREEVAGMRPEELQLDEDRPVWVLPSKRTKNGREHAVPLTPRLVQILGKMPKVGTQFVFTTTGETSISGFSRAKASLDAKMLAIAQKEAKERGVDPSEVTIAPWRLHDLRRTMATLMARKGVSVAVVEKVLNHVAGTFGGIVSVYQRHDYADAKLNALSIWGDHLDIFTSINR